MSAGQPRPAQAGKERAEPGEAGTRRSVLVVDDDEMIRDLVAAGLEDAGVLDTYQRAGGSALARTAEDLLRDAPPESLASGLGEVVRQLRALIGDGAA